MNKAPNSKYQIPSTKFQICHPEPVEGQICHPEPVEGQICHPELACPEFIEGSKGKFQICHPELACPEFIEGFTNY